MARLRLKIELNPGGVGVRLDKLAKISEEIEKFLRSLAQDCGTTITLGEWLAKDFYDGSFGSSVEFVKNVEPPAANKFNRGLRFFSRFRNGHLPPEYSPATVRQFIEIGDVIDTDEVVRLGIFDDPDSDEPTWEAITKLIIRNVDAVFHEEFKYEGALQGKLGTWYKDSNYFNLRDLASNSLIKCFYRPEMYDAIYRLYDDKDAVVNLTGTVTAGRVSGQAQEMRVVWARSYTPLSGSEYNRLFCLAPDLTGDMTAADYIDKMRTNDDTSPRRAQTSRSARQQVAHVILELLDDWDRIAADDLQRRSLSLPLRPLTEIFRS
jgi:hypothetical protein